MSIRIVIFLICLLGSALPVSAFQLAGVVTDDLGHPIPYASIFVQNTTYGVASNLKGQYYLELKSGTHVIVFQAIGYEKIIHEVTISGKNAILDVKLPQKVMNLGVVEVKADRKDPAYAIIKKAIAARSKWKHQLESYRCTTYVKASLEKEVFRKDTLTVWERKKDTLPDIMSKERMNFLESFGVSNWQAPNQFKEVRFAMKDLAERNDPGAQVSISIDTGDDSNEANSEVKNLFKTSLNEATFDFYRNNVDVPALGPVPFVSPISTTATVSYKYRLDETFLEGDLWINRIEVIPRRADGALFSGYIYITDSLWNIKAVDLEIDPSALYVFRYFRVVQEYSEVQDSVWMPTREELWYNSKEGRTTLLGHTLIMNSAYELNPVFPRNFFKNELRLIVDDAYDKDSLFWNEVRPITLKPEEELFINSQDSIANYHESAEYLTKRDSAYNRLTIWDFTLQGVGFRNSFKKRHIYFNPLLTSMNFFGVGGYRHAFGGKYEKEWSRANSIELDYKIHYGFRNQDLRGQIGASYLYQPKRAGRIHGQYRNTYNQFNTNDAVTTMFSMSNYVNDIFYSFGHEMEVYNGVLLDVMAEYGKKLPIKGLTFSKWTEELFGSDNTPLDFEPFSELVLDVKVRYRPGNKYYTEPYKKVNLGSKWPQLKFHFRRGIPGFLDSSVDYDFFEVEAKDDMKISTFGESRWNAGAGRFLSSKAVRITEFKFFRGSDPWLFSNPLRNFQLLGDRYSTKSNFVHGHYLHRFNGTLMNKVPLLRKAGFQTIAGGGVLYVADGLPDEAPGDLQHIELFAGLELPFRIRRQLFKIGIYAITADSNRSDLETQFKIGLDFFDTFGNRWSY